MLSTRVDMPLLSIVIPAKNEEQYLPGLLDSIECQTFIDREIIVADAWSEDKTRTLALAHGAQIVDGGMPGPGRNRGAAVATGDIIAFFDADVILPQPRFLEDCLEEFQKRELDAATCCVLPVGGRPIDRILYGAYNVFALATEHVRPHAPGLCIFVRRHVHEALGGFDERVVFAEDHEYVQRAARSGYHFGVLRSAAITTSNRRLEKDGRCRIAFRYLYGEFHLLTRGPFYRKPFRYEMGGEETHIET